METNILNDYKKAGIVWASSIKIAQKKCKEGTSLLALAQEIEKYALDEGCTPAFPVNLSINEEAAHFTPKWKDEYKLKESDILKVDIGVACNGYICDGAISINLDNKYAKQIEANDLALENAISKVGFGKEIDLIGAEIENTLKAKGFNPVYNLGGHGLEQYDIHSWPSIPNHSKGSTTIMDEEGVIAIEPFASTGEGKVGEVKNVEIFSIEGKPTVRNPAAREIYKVAEQYNKMPFAERWLRAQVNMDDFKFTFALKELMKTSIFHTYAGLKESKGAMVSQSEKSLIVLEDNVLVLGE
ncbi:MAG: type II methionyl aminopeptidase [archaeon]